MTGGPRRRLPSKWTASTPSPLTSAATWTRVPRDSLSQRARPAARRPRRGRKPVTPAGPSPWAESSVSGRNRRRLSAVRRRPCRRRRMRAGPVLAARAPRTPLPGNLLRAAAAGCPCALADPPPTAAKSATVSLPFVSDFTVFLLLAWLRLGKRPRLFLGCRRLSSEGSGLSSPAVNFSHQFLEEGDPVLPTAVSVYVPRLPQEREAMPSDRPWQGAQEGHTAAPWRSPRRSHAWTAGPASAE